VESRQMRAIPGPAVGIAVKMDLPNPPEFAQRAT
jgi:hypothetical protein